MQTPIRARTRKLLPTLLTLVHVALFSISPAFAQTPAKFEQIMQVELESLEHGKQTQLKIDEIDDKRMELAHEYRATLKQNTRLAKYNDVLRESIKSQEGSLVSLEEQINSISNLEQDIVPLMSEMLDTLEYFVALDVPFLHIERKRRIRELRQLLHDGNTTNSEKYRRILEAYQIENDYGRTIEAYDGDLKLEENHTQSVTFLKVGRIAYLYQTFDKSKTFRWSEKDKRWTRLDNKYNKLIDEGIKMAKEQIPSNLMFVPVTSPAKGSTL